MVKKKKKERIPETTNCDSGPPIFQIFIGVTLIGLLLRLINLGGNSLWLDEASTLSVARDSLAGIWSTMVAGEFNPPLFYWMEHIMLIFGQSEAVLRLIPAILGAATVVAMYFAAREVLDQPSSLVAATLMAVSPFAIYYSQEARAYAPMLFFFTVAIFFFLRATRKGGYENWIGFGAFSAIAFWTHFYAIVPVGVLILLAFAFKMDSIRKDHKEITAPLIAAGAFVIISLPLLVNTVKLFFARTGGGPSFGVQGLDAITETLVQVSGFSTITAVIFILLLLVGIIWYIQKDRKFVYLIVAGITIPLIASVILSYKMPMVPRYLIYLQPFLFLGISASFSFFCRKIKFKYLAVVATLMILAASIPFLSTYYTTPQKDDWRGFTNYLQGQTSPGDYVVVLPGYVLQPVKYYYNNQTDGTILLGAYKTGELDKIEQSAGDHNIFYVVTADIYSTDPSGGVLNWLESHTNNSNAIQYSSGIILLRKS